MKKLLITGVCGFIGFSFAKHLLENNKNVKILGIDNLNDYYSPKLKIQRLNILKKSKKFKFKKIDISNDKLLLKIFCIIIIHIFSITIQYVFELK